MKELSEYTQWFISSAYCVSGCPKMADALMDYVKERYLHHLICECDLNHLLAEINQQQTRLHNQNRRWQEVEVTITDRKSRGNESLIWLHIGAQFFTLQRVLGDY